MNFKERIKISFAILKRQKQRSISTTIEIATGIALLIIAFTLIHGEKKEIDKLLSPTGKTLIWVRDKRYTAPITKEDLKNIRENCFQAEKVIMDARKYIRIGEYRNSIVWATESDIRELLELEILKGRFFTRLEDKEGLPVCVLASENTAKRLFKNEEPIGKKLKIYGKEYEVIGILKNNPFFWMYELGIFCVAIIPFNSIPKEEQESYSLLIKVNNVNAIPSVSKKVLKILKNSHPQAEYEIETKLDLHKKQKEFVGILINLLGGLGIGIIFIATLGLLGIMLITVTERIRDIGIYRALGASKGDIIYQYLIETSLLCLIGGVIGLFIGIITTKILVQYFQLTAAIDYKTFLFAISFSIIVGLLSGLYPAIFASRINPIDALRYE